MGARKFREQVTSPSFNIVRTFNSTAAIIKNRVVKVMNTGNIKHTTGTSGRGFLGVALASATGAGIKVPVLLHGIASIHASTRAIAVGAYVRASSGAASTGSNLGGTVRAAIGEGSFDPRFDPSHRGGGLCPRLERRGFDGIQPRRHGALEYGRHDDRAARAA